MALSVVIGFAVLTFCLADVVPPEALNHVAHIAFPRDRLAAQILQTQRDKFGLPTELHCSSLLGPTCASPEALSPEVLRAVEETRRRRHPLRFGQLYGTLPPDSKGAASRSVPLDEIIIAELGLGPALTKEQIEDARNLLNDLDPTFLATVADRVADVALIQDRDRFRHKFLSAFASLLVEAKGSQSDEEESLYIDPDDTFLPPSRVDQEDTVEARREAAKMERITKRAKDAMAEILPVELYTEEEDEEQVLV